MSKYCRTAGEKMTLRINSVCAFNRVTNQYNENRSNVQKYPMTNAKSNAVSFKKI